MSSYRYTYNLFTLIIFRKSRHKFQYTALHRRNNWTTFICHTLFWCQEGDRFAYCIFSSAFTLVPGGHKKLQDLVALKNHFILYRRDIPRRDLRLHGRRGWEC